MADQPIQLTKEKLQTVEGVNELNRQLQTLFNLIAGDGVDQRVYSGYGVPTIAATTGSIYLRLNGTAGATLYVMEGSTWTAK